MDGKIVWTVLVLLTMLAIVVAVVYTRSLSTCGGTFDPKLRYCDPTTSRLVSGKPIPETECNPISDIEKLALASEFTIYMNKVNTAATQDTRVVDILRTSFPTADIHQGLLFFAIPPLLKLLASDFGQNELTPYGIVSFLPLYLENCISDVPDFCATVFKNKNDDDGSALIRTICRTFLRGNRRRRLDNGESAQCPFHVSDANPNLTIDDVGFFNLIGSLGTFSLTSSQCLVLYYDLPVASLPINYWSFNLYLADRLSADRCRPFRQTYLASLTPPLNCFMTPSIAGKQFNPITGEGDVVSKGRLRFYLVVSLHPETATTVRRSLETNRERQPFDFIHVFGVPTGPHSMVLDPSLPNPNHMTETTGMFDPETDRLSLFLRLSPDPSKDPQEDGVLRDFTRFEHPFDKNLCQVSLVDLKDAIIGDETYRYAQPRYILPMMNEKEQRQRAFEQLLDSFRRRLYASSFTWHRLPLRNSILNIFAPLFSSVLNTTQPYEGGWQAIQLAGIAQGDNPDTQYRLSGVVCLSPTDVMIAVAFNHAGVGNCLYNNINIVDVNKAYSVASITLTRDTTDADVYMVVAGRDATMVNRVVQTMRSENVACYPVHIPTASSIENGVPMCHQLVMVERIYVNLQYASSTQGTVHNLHSVFGENLRGIETTASMDAWNSLTNVVAPKLDTLIAPVFYKASPLASSRQARMRVYVLVFVMMTIVLTAWIWIGQK